MNNEEKILTALEQLTASIARLETGQAAMRDDIAEVKSSQAKLETGKLSGIAMDLDEKVERNHKEIIRKLNTLNRLTFRNITDIAELQEAVNMEYKTQAMQKPPAL